MIHVNILTFHFNYLKKNSPTYNNSQKFFTAKFLSLLLSQLISYYTAPELTLDWMI